MNYRRKDMGKGAVHLFMTFILRSRSVRERVTITDSCALQVTDAVTTLNLPPFRAYRIHIRAIIAVMQKMEMKGELSMGLRRREVREL
jgi:hypothetical protein